MILVVAFILAMWVMCFAVFWRIFRSSHQEPEPLSDELQQLQLANRQLQEEILSLWQALKSSEAENRQLRSVQGRK